MENSVKPKGHLYCIAVSTWGAGIAQLVELRTHKVKVPSSNPTSINPPKLHFRGGDSGMHCLHSQSSVNEILILGCQYQPVLAGLL